MWGSGFRNDFILTRFLHSFSGCSRNTLFKLLIALFLFQSAPSFAIEQDHNEQELHIPPALQPWVDWVEYQKDTCPKFMAKTNSVCAWPGQLKISTNEQGAQFTQHWTLYEPAAVSLPGDNKNWPRNISVNGEAHVVLEQNQHPVLYLDSGDYEIAGQFKWVKAPESLQLAPETGLIKLSVNGVDVPQITINTQQQLWLGQSQDTYKEQDEIQLRIGREIQDNQPIRMRILISADIYGSVREESIGPVIPEGFELIELKADIPARITQDGKLEWQLHPGTAQVEIMLRATTPIQQFETPSIDAPWPQQELWTFIPDHNLRSVRVEALNLIDPSQTHLPKEINIKHPLYLMSPGHSMVLHELSRGITKQENTLLIKRQAWLSFDAEKLIHKDYIVGRMEKDWRIDATVPFTVEYAHAPNDNLPQRKFLITKQTGEKEETVSNGFEWRTQDINVYAHANADFKHKLPLSAWNHELTQLDTELNLPPGHMLLHATGYDKVIGSWLSRWDILQVFLVILAAVCIYHLLSWHYAALAILFLVTASHESHAPHLLIIFTAIALLLKSWTQNEKAQKFINRIVMLSFILLSIQFLAFSFVQLQSAIYPQLEPRTYSHSIFPRYPDSIQPSDSVAPASAPKELRYRHPKRKTSEESIDGVILDRVEIIGSVSDPLSGLTPYDPTAHLQAATGIPQWQWHQYQLQRRGPVLPDEQQHLFVVYPWQHFLWRILSVITGLLTLYGLSLSFSNARRHKRTLLPGLLSIGLLLPLPATADDFPPTELLAELQNRLDPAPDCAPDCVQINELTIQAGKSNNSLILTAEIHSGANTLLPLPKPDKKNQWTISDLRLNEKISPSIKHGQHLYLPVHEGIHQLNIEVNTTNLNTLSFYFIVKPQQVKLSLTGWTSAGLVDQYLPGDTLSLYREPDYTDIPSNKVDYNAAPFFDVKRTISIDLQPNTYGIASKVNSSKSVLQARVPLFDHEKLAYTDESITTDGQYVNLAIEGEALSWAGDLPLQEHYEFSADELNNRSETWLFVVSPVLHASFNGIPETYTTSNNSPEVGYYYHFRPRPGETLTLDISRPTADAGQTIAIERATRSINTGRKHRDTTLELRLNVSEAGLFEFDLPAQAELLSLSSNGKPLPIQAIAGHLNIPVTTGSQLISFKWRESVEAHWHTQAPPLQLPLAARNVITSIDPPGERWILWVHGSGIGPAVQFWSLLALLLLTAFLLSRLTWSPLNFTQWLLLGLGFSTVQSGWFLWIVATFYIFHYRSQHSPDFQRRWRSALIQLALLIIAAITLFIMVNTVITGLLSQPDMHTRNPLLYGGIVDAIHSHHPYHWYSDSSSGELGASGIYSAPMWLYRLAMLMWSLWLSLHLVRWLRWGWKAINQDGFWPPKRRLQPESEKAAQNLENNNQTATERPND